MDNFNEKDIFGWSYELDIAPYVNNIEIIKEFLYKIDEDLNCFGCGFLLVFFHHSKIPLQAYYDKCGYFPYDSYLSLWSDISSRFKIYDGVMVPSHIDRNAAISELVKHNFLKGYENIYQIVHNPYEKIANRYNNLNILIK